MKGFVRAAKFFFTDFKYSWLVEEFDKNIHKELDFQKEGENIQRVKSFIKDQRFKNITVP